MHTFRRFMHGFRRFMHTFRRFTSFFKFFFAHDFLQGILYAISEEKERKNRRRFV